MIGRITRVAAIMLLVTVPLAGVAQPALAQDGQQASGGYHVQVVQVDTSAFPQVTVWVSVTDAQGNPVSSVPESAFSLIENGKPIEIRQVHQKGEQGMVSTVLVIDRSGSMNKSGKLDAAKTAANAFVDLMRSGDQTGVIVFNTQVDTIQPLTGDKDALHKAIAGITAINDTALYDGLAASEAMLTGVQGRRAVIVLSDGLDNSSKTSTDSFVASIKQAEISVYTIGLGDPSVGTASMAGINEAALKQIADQSRGTYSYTPDPSALSGLYQQLSSRLQNEYQLTYVSPNSLHDGVERGLDVQIGEAASVQAGYNPGGVIPETSQALAWPVFGGLLLALIGLLAVPDVLRGVGSMGGKRGLFKKKNRVKLTTAPDKKTPPASGPAKPRVRVSGK